MKRQIVFLCFSYFTWK